jgi:glycosyltransferase involved in cell wall biosynthesis
MLVEPRVEPVAAALQSILTDKALAHRLGNAGLERSRAFDWRRTAEQTVAVYTHVL